MKWVALAILLFIIPYTWLTLHYRKPGPAFRPYEDLKNRANVERLLAAGYRRIPLTAERPADPVRVTPAANTTAAAGGLPAELRATLVGDAPLLPAEIVRVAAAPTASAAGSYAIEFTCTVPNDKEQLAGAELFVHGAQLVILPRFERIGGELLTRSRESTVQLTVPPHAFQPGRYQITLVGERTSRAWSLDVR